MNYLVIATSLVLFALFYEVSGAEDFVPASEREQAAAEEEVMTASVFARHHVPFNSPVIISPEPAVQVAQARTSQVTGIVSASFTTTTDVVRPMREDVRAITGESVNLRAGPSTAFDVIKTASRGTEVALIAVNADNWARVRLLESNQTVWVAAWLLSD